MYNLFMDLISEYNLTHLNPSIPTRKDSILDVIYTNSPDKILKTKVIDIYEGSDHSPVLTQKSFNISSESQEYMEYRKLKDYNNYDVQSRLICDTRHTDILSTHDPNEAMKMLVNIFNDALKYTAPIVKIMKKKDKENKVNLTINTLDYMKLVDIQKDIVNSDKDNIVEVQYLNEMKKKLIKMKDSDRFRLKADYLRNQKNEYGLWKAFKQYYNDDNKKPTVLNYNNKLIKGPKNMANTFNVAFTNKTKDIKKNIKQQADPLINYKKSIKTASTKFYFNQVSLKQMSQTVNKIKSTNTTGTDRISSKLVKDQSYILIPILTHIFNLCIIKKDIF